MVLIKLSNLFDIKMSSHVCNTLAQQYVSLNRWYVIWFSDLCT